MFEPTNERMLRECSIWTDFTARGVWVPKLFDRQFEVFNSGVRALLVCGPRLSGKTIAVLHRIIRHMWETPGARVAIFSKTLKNAKDGGNWDSIIKVVIPEWLGLEGDTGLPLEFTTFNGEGTPGPKVDGQTRTPFFRIRNKFGGESECKLFSLDYVHDAENKLKETNYSLIYFSELDKFEDRKVLSVALMQLRMQHLRYDQHMWIADTNPGEEGEESWIYKAWYEERVIEYSAYVERQKKNGQISLSEDEFIHFQRTLSLIEIKPEENPFLDPLQLKELRMTYAYDPDLYARYVEGKWVLGKGAAGRHFSGYFIPELHVRGSRISETEWETIVPDKDSTELITGFDLGETNHAAAILDKVMGKDGKWNYHLLDEAVSIKQEVSIETFTAELFMPKLDEIISMAGRPLKTERNWSDRSSIEKYVSTADTYQYLVVWAASNSRIFLSGTPKPKESVRDRVRILKRLLSEKRFKVSAHCEHAIAMLRFLRKGDTEDQYVVSDKHKHIFDAITYAIKMEMMEELEEFCIKTQKRDITGVAISIPL